MLIKIHYMYRDASNYKFHGHFIVDGAVNRQDLEPFLIDGEYFVPHEVGLDHLLDMPMNEDDHYLHTLERFIPTNNNSALCSAIDLINRFKSASKNGWFSSFR